MAKKALGPERLPPPRLTEPKANAAQKIQAQIEKGQQIRNKEIRTKDELDEARAECSKWSKYNTELLQRIFDNSSMADEYNRFYGKAISMHPTLPELIDDFRRDMDDSINRLEAIHDRLDLIPEPAAGPSPTIPPPTSTENSTDVFIVHGHDDAAKETVARFVEKLGIGAIILYEQPNASRTIIEKFEAYANVGFAIILLTPDDICASRDKATEGKARARQNVIFELGYFFGRLGRQRVCALHKEGVELPSDIHGVLYVPMDNGGAWRLALAREMKHAGLPIDMNKAV
jgi:predicted nucleotide-binding protein